MKKFKINVYIKLLGFLFSIIISVMLQNYVPFINKTVLAIATVMFIQVLPMILWVVFVIIVEYIANINIYYNKHKLKQVK